MLFSGKAQKAIVCPINFRQGNQICFSLCDHLLHGDEECQFCTHLQQCEDKNEERTVEGMLDHVQCGPIFQVERLLQCDVYVCAYV